MPWHATEALPPALTFGSPPFHHGARGLPMQLLLVKNSPAMRGEFGVQSPKGYISGEKGKASHPAVFWPGNPVAYAVHVSQIGQD